MIYRYIFHESVKADYDEAYEWYEEQQEGLGERFLSAFRSKMEQIAQRPEVYGEKAKKKYREAALDVFPFSIVYKVYKREKKIFVISIQHHKRHPKNKYRK
jgi:plasmid stabilization system protein ParE